MEWTIIAGYLAVGSLMKFTDDILDKGIRGKSISNLALLTGILYGAGMGILMSMNFYPIYIFGAIIIACLLTRKIDNRAHVLALFTALFIVFTSSAAIINISNINWFIFLFITASAILDESGEIFKSNSLRKFFDRRFGMRFTLFLLALTNLVGWIAFVQLIVFDIAYVVTGRISPRLMSGISKNV